MIALIRKLFWVGLFLVFTIGFVTLFDHHFTTAPQFIADAKSELNDFMGLWKPLHREKDKSDQVAP